jgi:hypothetical protein
MNFEITQSLERKFQRRVERLRHVDGRFLFSAMKQFFSFLETEPMLSGIFEEINSQFPLPENFGFDSLTSNDLNNVKNEKELMTLSFKALKCLTIENHFNSTSEVALQVAHKLRLMTEG